MGLSELQRNEISRIQSLDGAGMERVAAMGFTPGAEVRMVRNSGRGPIVVYIRQTEVALGRQAAERIKVEGGER